MFDDTITNISRIYKCFKCQHHFIQGAGHDDERPDIPCLTPGGFDTWARVLIEAHPNREYKRLQKAVNMFQIRDKGGLPITIDRSHFPKTADLRIRRDFIRSLADNAPTAHKFSYRFAD